MSEIRDIAAQFKSRFQKDENRSLFNNFVALFILQLINYALPLLILPYLTQKLGPSNYGKIAWAQYAIQYLIIFTDYGFNFSATRLVSVNRKDKNYLHSVFSSVMFIKLFLLILSYGLLLAWILFSNFGSQEIFLLNISFLMVAGSVITPLWLFQGLEKMKWITWVNIVVKTLLVVFVFMFITERKDVELTATLLAFAQLAIGVLSFVLALTQLKIKISIPSAKELFFQFKEGWFVFVSTLFTAIYVTSNGFLLGEWDGESAVGYYTPAEKIVRAVTSFFNPVMTALYPFISKKFSEDKEQATRLFFKILKIVSVFTFIISCFLFLLAPLADDFLGSEYTNSIGVIKWLAFIPFFGTAGAMLSYHLFLNAGLKRWLPYLLGFLAAADILLCYFLIPKFHETGAAMALMIIEITAPVMYLVVYYFYKTVNDKY
jgi:PST family polysaccharide transporter